MAAVDPGLATPASDVQASTAAQALLRLGIGFVVATRPVPPALAQQLDTTAGLTRLGESGSYALWRVEPDRRRPCRPDGCRTPQPPARVRLVDATGQLVQDVPWRARTRGSTRPCRAARPGGRSSWPSRPAACGAPSVDDVPLRPTASGGLQAFPCRPTGGRLVIAPGGRPAPAAAGRRASRSSSWPCWLCRSAGAAGRAGCSLMRSLIRPALVLVAGRRAGARRSAACPTCTLSAGRVRATAATRARPGGRRGRAGDPVDPRLLQARKPLGSKASTPRRPWLRRRSGSRPADRPDRPASSVVRRGQPPAGSPRAGHVRRVRGGRRGRGRARLDPPRRARRGRHPDRRSRDRCCCPARVRWRRAGRCPDDARHHRRPARAVDLACQPPAAETWLVGGGGEPGRRGRVVLTNPSPERRDGRPGRLRRQGTGPLPAARGIVVGAHKRTVVLLDAIAPGERSPVIHVGASGLVAASLNDSWLDGTTPVGADDVVGTHAGHAAGRPRRHGERRPGSLVLRVARDRRAVVRVRLLGTDGPGRRARSTTASSGWPRTGSRTSTCPACRPGTTASS